MGGILKTAFQEQYPSEVFDSENTPSTHLLSHVYKQASTKDFAVVPWKFRLSVKLHEEQQLAKPIPKP